MRLPNSPHEGHADDATRATSTLREGGYASLPRIVPLPPSDEAPRAWQKALQALSERADEAVSLSIDLPFCAAHCLCCDRAVLAAQPREVIDDYVDGLIAETAAVAARAGADHDLLQLHVGGGSASELEEDQLARLVTAVRDTWRLPADAEMSIDCDPRRIGWMSLQLMRSLGFSRIRLGVLDLDDRVQQAIGRRHSQALIDDVCQLARDSGMETIELQLMVGLPYQHADGWRRTLRRLVAMAPDRLTLARYQHRPWLAPGQHAIDADTLPDETECLELMRISADLLREAGYRWIGADHFVLESDELATAQEQGRLRFTPIAYTGMPPSALIGHGVGAHSCIDGDGFGNAATLGGWRGALREGRSPVERLQRCTPTEARRQAALQQLMCRQELPRALAEDGLELGYAALARHAPRGLVQVEADRIVVTDVGRLQLAALCAELGPPPQEQVL
jgi:oxygen-independent coproporphyrinogen-3 oxidase